MQLVTLTAPDGHKERWDFKTTYLALLSWYSYLKDTDNAKEPTKIAKQIGKFVGDDIKQVHMYLVYLDGFNGDLYSKLSLLAHNSNKSTVQLYFVMKSINNTDYLPHSKQKERQRQKTIERINQITNNDPETLKRLTELTKLFVNGQLHYSNMEGWTMERKDFLETNNFYNLTNDAKLLYLYLDAYKDKDNLVYCSELIAHMLGVTGKELNELKEAGFINYDEYLVPVEIVEECN